MQSIASISRELLHVDEASGVYLHTFAWVACRNHGSLERIADPRNVVEQLFWDGQNTVQLESCERWAAASGGSHHHGLHAQTVITFLPFDSASVPTGTSSSVQYTT